MSEHRAQSAAEVEFLRQRWTAINALPAPLRKEAIKEDMTPWPKHFLPIPWTPKEYVERFGKDNPEAATDFAEEGKQ
jgi:hypothetical protein